MKGLVKENLAQDGLALRTDLATPSASFAEVKIKVLAAAVCGTDKGIYKSSNNASIQTEMRRYNKDGQYKPVIVGHEFCGVIEEVGQSGKEALFVPPQLRLEVGDYVSAEMHIACGFCNLCRSGNQHICTSVMVKGLHLDGCFAESIVVPYENVLLLSKSSEPKKIIPRVAAMLDAFGNAVHTVQKADVAGKSVAILGAGPLGLMLSMLCKHHGAAKIFVTEVIDIERRFGLAAEFGADACFDVSKGAAHFYQAIENSSLGSNGVDVVLEASGAAGAYKDALKIVRNGGLILLLGLARQPLDGFDVTQGVIFKGVTIKGIFGREMFATWHTMLQLLSADRFGLASSLEKILPKQDYPLSEYRQAFESLIAGKELKLVFTP